MENNPIKFIDPFGLYSDGIENSGEDGGGCGCSNFGCSTFCTAFLSTAFGAATGGLTKYGLIGGIVGGGSSLAFSFFCRDFCSNCTAP